MTLGEFDLIARYFTRPTRSAVLGVGDDCALLRPAAAMQWAVSTDMLVQGRHFFADVAPACLGHKALAVNLSDLAACGAQPVAFTLALALPQAEPAFLEDFSRGLWTLADAYACELVGGDTTQGPLTICITVFGQVPPGQALLRSGARPGDDLYVSGSLGDARLALDALLGKVTLPPDVLAQARQALELPQPRVPLGMALRGVASSAIDISDGLVGDLGHLLVQSKVGATVWVDSLPLGTAVRTQSVDRQRLCGLSGGDDYELLFSAAPQQARRVQDAASQAQVAVTRIGQIDAQIGLRLTGTQGQLLHSAYPSFDHFFSP
jgi:thiamine-monophosphate kinase